MQALRNLEKSLRHCNNNTLPATCNHRYRLQFKDSLIRLINSECDMSNLSNDADWKKLYNLVDDLSKRQDCGTLLYHTLTRITTTYVFFSTGDGSRLGVSLLSMLLIILLFVVS